VRNPRLFTDQPLTPGDQVVLKGNVAQHLGRVLRARSGDHIALFNGDGQEFAAQVLTVSKGEVSVEVGAAATPQTESPVFTTLGLCLSKGDRFDWAIQKATELGVGAIAPLLSERVDFNIPPDRIEKRVAHWQQIAISACEQCGRVKIPSITPPQSLVSWIENVSAEQKWVLHCKEDTGVSASAVNQGAPRDAALLIGPEGGLTNHEFAAASTEGFQLLQLGPRVLRTETAPAAALSVLSVFWGEMPS
jgi:16S rRNA (uracil1498-N3)-methyltransferase